MNRRQFLIRAASAGALTTLLGGQGHALGPQQQLRLMRLQHSGIWDANRGALQVLAEETRMRTSMDVAIESTPVTADSPTLYSSMIAVLAGDAPVRFSDAERAGLKRWLGLGGFLVIDNTGVAGPSQAFTRSIEREVTAMFPGEALHRLSPEHVLYRTFYRLDYPAGRAIHKPYVEGLKLGRRYAIVSTANDLTGAFVKETGGAYRMTPAPGGENQREMAFRFGVNLLMYATCLHYKDDQVHIDFLLRKRKWKITPPR